MPLWQRNSPPVDRITSDALAEYGRVRFLGRVYPGAHDSWSLVSPLAMPALKPADGAGRGLIVSELKRHAAKGDWEKIGAWKLVRDMFSEDGSQDPDLLQLIDGGLVTVNRMRVTNLGIHLSTSDHIRYMELFGERPPVDGFFGPPVFDSDFGPTRQYYFDSALNAAAARRINRVPSQSGVTPGTPEEAVKRMWDFGQLVYRGPLVVSSDSSFEPSVVKAAVDAATGVDHQMFADLLVEAALNRDARHYGSWTSIGSARFIEDYLDPQVAESPSCLRAIDDGLTQLHTQGYIGLLFTPELLTPRQRARLAAIIA